jgi:hypothetical protein
VVKVSDVKANSAGTAVPEEVSATTIVGDVAHVVVLSKDPTGGLIVSVYDCVPSV